MIKPSIPSNETTRLDTLRSLSILDSGPEERFDRLTRLAKRLFGVPIALVSLVDADRQWFKSCVGLTASETARDISFCGHAILGDEILVVPDAKRDERFHDNPLVVDEPRIRFYAGCPLKVSNGSRLGTLCLIDVEPRTLSPDDLNLLRDLAGMAEQELAAVQLATTDELTLLSNRRGFLALAQHALHLCRRAGHPASLLFVDMDRFKEINDRFGHAEGDGALCSFAGALKEVFRDSDVIGRLGGDEFAVLLTNTAQSAATEALRRLKRAVQTLNCSSQRGYDIHFSTGQLTYDPVRHGSIDTLLSEADALMYEQKKRSREMRIAV
jgi:diguanylate cyclase (GGDEF)-like protein